jgi:hypothetical protein
VTHSEIAGSAGVAMLLAAYFGNAYGVLPNGSFAYRALNAAGAALACWASLQIRFIPFVVLEAIWFAVAAAALLRPPPSSTPAR